MKLNTLIIIVKVCLFKKKSINYYIIIINKKLKKCIYIIVKCVNLTSYKMRLNKTFKNSKFIIKIFELENLIYYKDYFRT
jgi:hypothetical protein